MWLPAEMVFQYNHKNRMHIYCTFDATLVWTSVTSPKCCLDRIYCNEAFVGTKLVAQVFEMHEMWYHPSRKRQPTYRQ